MRLILSLAALALVAGCSTVSAVRDAWRWDPASGQARTTATLSPEQAASLTNRVAELQIERNQIRSRISAESDVWMRQRLYDDLHRLGMELSPLERQLFAVAPAP